MTQHFHSKTVLSIENTRPHKNLYIQMVAAALFLTAPKWNQSKCPSTEEWMNEEWKYSEQANPGDRK